MGYGFSAINNNDIIVIDQDFSNYCLHSTITVDNANCSYGTFQNNFGHYYKSLYIPNILGVIALCNSTHDVSCWSSLSAHGTNQILIIPDYGLNFSFQIYFYVPSTAFSVTSGYGLNVYNQLGNLTFSSTLSYLKHLVTYTVDTRNSSELPYPIGISNPVFVLNPFHMQGDYHYQYEGGLYYSGTSAYFASISNINGRYYLETRSDAIDNLNNASWSGSGSGFAYWEENCHIYLGRI